MTAKIFLQRKMYNGLYKFVLEKAHSSNISSSTCRTSVLHTPSEVLTTSSITPIFSIDSLSESCSSSSFKVWHKLLGHATPVIHYILKSCNIYGLSNKKFFVCHACAVSKCHTLPFTNSHIDYHASLELVVVDLWDLPLKHCNGFKYYISLVDVYSRYT